MTNAQHYAKPPVVEAVIDLKFAQSLPDKILDRVRDRFKRNFPKVDEKRSVQFEIQPNKVATNSRLAGYKMTAQNAADMILINSDSFGSVRLAPYQKWDALRALAERNFEVFTKVAGRQEITRIGVRYINRIDIPEEQVKGRPLADFIKVGVSVPPEVTEIIAGYSMSAAGVEVSTGAKLNIQCGFVPSPLIDFVSITLDIDVYWDAGIPGRIDQVWSRADALRTAKNAVFEHCITDLTRALFQ